jgi:hypothetical protein
MSRYHGEQYWTQVRHHARYGWRDLSDDDLDTIAAMRRDHEVRTRDQRTRARRSKWFETRELET